MVSSENLFACGTRGSAGKVPAEPKNSPAEPPGSAEPRLRNAALVRARPNRRTKQACVLSRPNLRCHKTVSSSLLTYLHTDFRSDQRWRFRVTSQTIICHQEALHSMFTYWNKIMKCNDGVLLEFLVTSCWPSGVTPRTPRARLFRHMYATSLLSLSCLL